ncbi:ankyrin repeat domain-containing protein [Paenalcaligenes sp. Me131]|uniref:ankyrin repeat domain-containing protein n=1 Tax=Paenalcaligenes sp. Me131 TaxID=3392636 RepID=UPI003D28AB8B
MKKPLWSALLAGIALSSALVSPVWAGEGWWNDVINNRKSDVLQELATGADPNQKTEQGQPTIMLSIQNKSWDVYDVLSAHRAIDVNITNAHDETPLMYLALLGETKRAEELIKRGAKVRRLGWTPLHYAASTGQTDMARMLLAEGALPNSPSADGTSPLMMAARSGRRDVVDLLIAAGADPKAVNLQHLTAADWARENGHTSLASYLEQVGNPAATPAAAVDSQAPSTPSAPSTTQSSGGSGGSQYFDLGRFDD